MIQEKKCKGIVLGFFIGLLSSVNVLAADEVHSIADENTDKLKAFDISIGTELMSGDTTYSIGFPVTFPDGSSLEGYFPFSQLEWPLDIWLARVDAGLSIGSSWRINGVLKTNISDPNDHMIDRDWLPPGSWLDVYSESNISDFDALIWDIDVEWTFLQRQSWNLYAGLGYQYQNFDYAAQLIQQYSPSGIPGFDFIGDGSVTITYEMTYKMPYALIGTDFQITPNFAIAGSIAYSPWVSAEDEDHHLIRDIEFKGDMDGDAVMFDLSGIYDFHSSWFLEGGVHYTKIDVDGDQTQWTDDVILGTVHEESESTQTSAYLNIGYRF